MNIELINNDWRFEIWADNQHMETIGKQKGENWTDYKARASKYFDGYVQRLQGIKAAQTGKQTVKSVSI